MTDPLLLPGTDPLSLSLYKLSRMVASSATLQALMNVDTPAAAQALITYKEATSRGRTPV